MLCYLSPGFDVSSAPGESEKYLQAAAKPLSCLFLGPS